MSSGDVIGRGRDCEILDYGDGKVLRRPFVARSLAAEGEVMQYAHERGYPVPRYFGEADGGIVIERVDGPTMLDAMIRKPLLRVWGRQLAELHRRLHEIEAPPGLRRLTRTGDRLLHVDLHPENVILTQTGPVVIDWSNAGVGEAGFDVALAWVLMATSEIPQPQPLKTIAAGLRRLFVHHFVAAAGRDDAMAHLGAAGEYRRADPNVTAAERDRVDDLVRRRLGT
ncbi:MAG TPA: phosphotransferase [Acidimicrobiales bacterium]|nr:phosphotransferase [Acidimicrobiales bacterium]